MGEGPAAEHRAQNGSGTSRAGSGSFVGATSTSFAQPPRLTELSDEQGRDLTLVYSARDTEHNDAVVLADVLRRGLLGSEARR